MAKQTITSGSAPLIWSSIDDAFNKINSNFTELYASIGETGSIGFDSLETNVIPSQNDTYDLGSATRRWGNLFLSRTLSIGGASITNEGLTIDLPSGTTVNGQLIIDPEKPFFKEVSVNGDTSVVADQFNDTINLEEGTGIDLSVNSSSDTVIIANSGVTGVIAGYGMSVSSATGTVTITNAGVRSVTAGDGMEIVDSSSTGDITIHNNGVLRLEAGPSITLSNSGLPDEDGKIIITNSAPAGNAYRNIAVAGEATLTAPSLAATLTFIEGSGVNITTALAAGALTNRVTFENTGVLSLTAGNGVTLSGSTGNITISVGSGDLKGSLFADDSTMLIDGTNGRIVGPVFADVTGNVTGNTTGYHTGDVKGSVFGDDSSLIVDAVSGVLYGALTGNVTGNLTGYQTGDMTGSVFGQDSTKLIDGVESKIVGPVETNTVKASSYIQTAVYADAAAITSGIPIAVKGMIVYDEGAGQFKGFNGSVWVALN